MPGLQEIIATQWPFHAVLQDIYTNGSSEKRKTEDGLQRERQSVVHGDRKESRPSIEKDKHSSRLQSTLNLVGKHKPDLKNFLYRLTIYRTKTTNKRLAKQHRRDRIYLQGEQVKNPAFFGNGHLQERGDRLCYRYVLIRSGSSAPCNAKWMICSRGCLVQTGKSVKVAC